MLKISQLPINICVSLINIKERLHEARPAEVDRDIVCLLENEDSSMIYNLSMKKI